MSRSIVFRIAAVLTIAFSPIAFSEGITLEQVIREVCTQSDSAKMMKQSVKKADEMVREKWSNAYPVISANVYVARNRGSVFGGSSGGGSTSRTFASAETPAQQGIARHLQVASLADTISMALGQIIPAMFSGFSEPQMSTIYSTGLSINQPIYTFGKVGTAIKIAKMFNQAAYCSYERNMQTLQVTAIDAFFATVMAAKAGEIAERSLARKRELSGFLERNFELGSGSKAQLLATKADMANQTSAVVIAQRDALNARMYLNSLMGRPLTDSAVLDTVTMLSTLLSDRLQSPEETVVAAKAQRADLKSLGLLEESNRDGAKIFRAMYLPSIAAMGSVGYSKYESGSAIMSNDGTANWSVGVGMQWMLFDGFANSAKAAQYQSDAMKLEIARGSVSKMIEIEIRSDLAECSAADSNLSASHEAFAAALEGYELTNSNFKQGSGQFADLQLADMMLQQAELGLINAKYRQLKSRAVLRAAMGREIVSINGEQK
ncbi:MAG: TolC family protein [Chitinispirillaceae bacterium]|jgi:HAE1 family hydrophobic/amphiphilic exporter-1|nr:TolC family protein [Chitinispirillaceae bacterium]